jgi:hypothetical protein
MVCNLSEWRGRSGKKIKGRIAHGEEIMKLRHGAAALLLFPFAMVNAALVTIDTSLGAQTGVLDTTTNLEWLKVSATAGLTPDQVFAQMTPGGRLAGYRYASSNELTCGLIPTQIPGASCGFTWSTRDVAPVFAFLDRFGTGFDQPVLFQAEAPTGTRIPVANGGIFELRTFTDGVQFASCDAQQITLPSRPSNHWLVHDVPEPSTWMLIGVAGLMLTGWRASSARRQRASFPR